MFNTLVKRVYIV